MIWTMVQVKSVSASPSQASLGVVRKGQQGFPFCQAFKLSLTTFVSFAQPIHAPDNEWPTLSATAALPIDRLVWMHSIRSAPAGKTLSIYHQPFLNLLPQRSTSVCRNAWLSFHPMGLVRYQ